MEFKELFYLFRRWAWLLIGCLVLALAVGYLASQIQAPVYEASTQVLVTRSNQQGSSDVLGISEEQLVMTYLQLLKTAPILAEAGSRVGIRIDPADTQVALIPNTQIIQLKIRDRNPERAAEIANTMIQILVEQNETLQSGRFTLYEDGLNLQIAQVQDQINNLESEIVELNQANVQNQLMQVNEQITSIQSQISSLAKEIAGFPNALSAAQNMELADKQVQLDQMRSLLGLYQEIQTNLTFIGQPVQGNSVRDDPQISRLKSTLDLYQQLYLDLLNNREAVRVARAQNTPTVVSLEQASVPLKPLFPNPLLYTVLSAVVGLFMAAGGILLLDYFDDSFKTVQQIEEKLQIPLLGIVSGAGEGDAASFAQQNPLSEQVETYRTLATSIELNAPEHTHLLIIASADVTAEKGPIAANVAAAMAQQGKRVVLVDGDLRDPHLERLFGMEPRQGLAELMRGELTTEDAVCRIPGINGLNLLSAGATNGSKSWIDRTKLTKLLVELQENIDLIIIDAPQVDSADAQILISEADRVLLVIRPTQTPVNSAIGVLRRCRLIGAKVEGAIADMGTPAPIITRQILARLRFLRRKEVAASVSSETDHDPVSLS